MMSCGSSAAGVVHWAQSGRADAMRSWPEDLASGASVEGWKNEPYSNFGCATQSTIAAQVDDPRDLVQPRALGPSDVAMRTRAIEDVRNGQDPSTRLEETPCLTPIGGDLPTDGHD